MALPKAWNLNLNIIKNPLKSNITATTGKTGQPCDNTIKAAKNIKLWADKENFGEAPDKMPLKKPLTPASKKLI
jgi:hypothetical protein